MTSVASLEAKRMQKKSKLNRSQTVKNKTRNFKINHNKIQQRLMCKSIKYFLTLACDTNISARNQTSIEQKEKN